MWAWLLIVWDITKLLIKALITAAKYIMKILMVAFSFMVSSIEELGTLNWQDERHRPKIIKNVSIIIGSVLVVIFIIYMLFIILGGGRSSSSSSTPNIKYTTSTTAKKDTAQQTTRQIESTAESKRIIETEVTEEKKRGWQIDPHEPNEYVYYDDNYKKIVNSDYKIDGCWYYFDTYGHVIKNQWRGDYYYDDSGKMATNTWVGDYYVGEDGKYVESVEATNIKYETTVFETVSVASQIVTNNLESASMIVETEVTNMHSAEYFYIDGNLDTYTEEFDLEENYSSKAIIVIPKISGKDSNNVAKANEFLDAAKEEIIAEVENILCEESPAYKTLNISNCEISSQSEKKLRVSLAGTLKPNIGKSKNIRYLFTYDVDEDDYNLERKQ